MQRVDGTYFNFEGAQIQGAHFVAGPETRLVRFQDCALTQASLAYEESGPEVRVILKNCTGTLWEEGPGQKRKVTPP